MPLLLMHDHASLYSESLPKFACMCLAHFLYTCACQAMRICHIYVTLWYIKFYIAKQSVPIIVK